MKKILLLTVAFICYLATQAQIDDPKFEFRTSKKQVPSVSREPGAMDYKPGELNHSPDQATTFDPAWANRFQTVLDSVMQATGGKGASIAVYTPEEGMWAGVSGTSSGWTAITPEMRFGIGSNTKLFIAVTMLKLQEEGVLSMDDHLYQWLPSFPNIDSTTTILQLLSHQSGIFDYWNDSPSLINYIWPDTGRFWTSEEIIASIGLPHFAPGNGYSYSNTNYVLAGMIIEAATGQTWVQKLHDIIFDPLTLDSTFVGAFEPRNGPVAAEWDIFSGNLIINSPMTAEYSQANACGGMLAAAPEMLQWYNALFNGSILSDSSMKLLLSFDPSSLYGLGVIQGGTGVPFYYHTGGMMGYVSIILYDPQRKATLCYLFNDRESDFGAKLNALMPVFFDEYPRRPDDAGILAVLAPWEHYCSNVITPEVVLRNFGSEPLTSTSINYRIDEETVNVFEWTGSLDPGQVIQVVLPAINAEEGAHGFCCYTSMPNGEPEGYTFNDTLQSNFFINSSTSALTGVFEGFDGNGFPQEGWTLSSSSIQQWGETSLTGYQGSGAGVKDNYDGWGVYGDYCDLQLPLINVSGSYNTDFSFDYAYAPYPGNMADSLRVSVSEDCGATWQTLFYKGGFTLRTSPPQYDVFYPQYEGQWAHESYSLEGFEGDILIRFRARFGNSNNLYIDNILVGSPVGVPEEVGGQRLAVSGYPNPTNGIYNVQFTTYNLQRVTLKIYDVNGREVAVVLDEKLPAGEQTVSFDASGLPAGVYYYRLAVGGWQSAVGGKLVKY